MNEPVRTTTPSLEDNLDVIYGTLYLPKLTIYLETLINSYIDAYHVILAKCTSSATPSTEDLRLLQLLSGPINEIYNPENPRLANGQRYPAVDIILNKMNEYSTSQTSSKSFIRNLSKPNTPPMFDNSNMGFLDLIFIFGIIAISIVFLVYIAILLLK